MRFCIGGCVANSLDDSDESSGDSMYRWASAEDLACTTVLSDANISNAERSPDGFLVNDTAVASASDSRLLDIDAFNSVAAIGARTSGIIARITGSWFCFLAEREPNQSNLIVMSDIKAIIPAVVAAMADTSVSLFAMCAISCATTPCSSCLFIFSNKPVVNAIRACSGSLPVANAFGAVSCTTATLGIGRPEAIDISRTRANNFGLSSSFIIFALVSAITSLSEA